VHDQEEWFLVGTVRFSHRKPCRECLRVEGKGQLSTNRDNLFRFLRMTRIAFYHIVFGRFYVFLLPEIKAHYMARLEHLASLGLDLNGKSVL
jgi:hypothetical protein